MAQQKEPQVNIGSTSRLVRWSAAAMAVVIISGAGAALLFHSHAATIPATLSMAPASGTLHVGDTLSVVVNENSGTGLISTVQADLTYPTALLQYTGIDATGSAFNDAAPPPITSTGVVSITRAVANGVTGTQKFVTANFKVLAAGPATITFASSSAIYAKADASNVFTMTGTTGGTYALQLPPVVGDVNGDRHVNAADIAVMLSHWNQTGATLAQGDLNGDGKVTAIDIAILLTNWGV